MAKPLKIVGLILVGTFVLVGVAVGIFMWVGKQLDTESKTFVDKAIPAIVGRWNIQELEVRSTPEFRKRLLASGAVSFPTSLTVLGQMTKYDGSSGEALVSLWIGSDSKITASYIAKADFERGRAQFRISLVKSGGGWFFDDIYVWVTLHKRSIQNAKREMLGVVAPT